MNANENNFDKNLSAKNVSSAYRYLFETVQTLRSKNGCPWDKEQTPLSMRQDLIEEVFETVDAISEENPEHAKEELGDVILNATMISYMYEQEKKFTVSDVINELTEKLIRRHPHVFKESEGQCVATGNVKTGDEVLAQWDIIKDKVENRETKNSILDSIPKNFPPLLRAYKMQKKAAKKGFDWNTPDEAKEKFFEEVKEVEEAEKNISDNVKSNPYTVNLSEGETQLLLHLEEEIGDAFFALVNYARKLGINPVNALERANQKFYNRFSYIEKKCKEKNIPMDKAHLKEQDALWNEAKTRGL